MKTALIVKMRDGHQIADEYPFDQGKKLIEKWEGGYKGFLHVVMPGGWEFCIHTDNIICIQTAFIQEQGIQPQQGMQQIPRRPLPGTSGLNN